METSPRQSSPPLNLKLIPMTEDELPQAFSSLVVTFAELLRPTRDLTMEQALAESEAQFGSLIPRGLDTPCQHFRQIMLIPKLSIYTVPQPIGMVWVHINPVNQYGILCWFEIYKSWRGQQISPQAFQLVEDWLCEMRVPVLSLEVFAHNAPARALYTKMGFKQTGLVMLKKLL